MSKIKLYSFPLSGHSHRVNVFLSILKLDYKVIDLDLKNGAHKAQEFVEKSLFGQIPAIDDGDISLADSNAILIYLAQKYDAARTWYPESLETQARIQQFLSNAAGPIAFGVAKARLANVFGAKIDKEAVLTASHNNLQVLEKHLQAKNWLVTDQPTIADVASYTYIAHAPEGDVSLEDYPNLRAWIERFESLDGFIPMQSSAVGLKAK